MPVLFITMRILTAAIKVLRKIPKGSYNKTQLVYGASLCNYNDIATKVYDVDTATGTWFNLCFCFNFCIRFVFIYYC